MKKPLVFLSYAREDKSLARRVCSTLRSEGVEVWFDEDSLIGGQKWLPAITKAIGESDFFLALLSNASVSKKGIVQKEMREALRILEKLPDNQIFIIPVRLDDCSPTFDILNEIHWIDLFQDWNEAIRNILRAILPDRVMIQKPAMPSPFEELGETVNTTLGVGRPEPTRVTTILHEAVAGFEKYAAKRRVVINIKDLSEGARVNVDSSSLGLVLSNLLHNAVKYSFSSPHEKARVNVISDVDGANVKISVENVGLGIAKDEISSESIFQPGYRSRFSRDLPGQGLGLYVAREVLRRQCGTLSVDSKPLRGSVQSPDMHAPFVTKLEISLPKVDG